MSGPVRLGIIPTVVPVLLPRLMPALRAAYPRLRIFLREDTTERLIERLAANQLDVALLALPCACGPADTLALARDPFVVALPSGHPLAALDAVPAFALAHERLLLLEDGHCLPDQALDACGYVRGDAPEGEDGFAAPTCIRWCRWWPAVSASPCCPSSPSMPASPPQRMSCCVR